MSELESKLKRVSHHFGWNNRLMKVIEEMAELTQAIVKYKIGEGPLEKVVDEIADVKNTLYCVTNILGRDTEIEEVQNSKADKIIEKEKIWP